MHHWILNLVKEGSGSKIIKGDQEEAEAMVNYFEAVFAQEPLLDEELEPNTKSTNHLLAVNFDRDELPKALSTFYQCHSFNTRKNSQKHHGDICGNQQFFEQ